MKVKKYFDELNIFRALVILWVTLGHSTLLAGDYSSFDLQGFCHGYAYSFHMPALFMLSGMLFAGKFNNSKSFADKSKVIANRFTRLMVPYFFYTAVSYLLKMFTEKYAYNALPTGRKAFVDILFGINNPNGGIWFLNTLFFISLISIMINIIDIRIITAGAFAVSLLANFTSVLNFNYIRNICLYSVFFFIGIMLMSNSIYEKISEKISKIKNKNMLSIISVIGIMLSFAITYINLYKINNSILRYIIIYINILVWYTAAAAVSVNSKFTKKCSMCIGNYGMDIYMIGYYVQIAIRVVLYSMLGVNAHICSLAMFVLAIIVPIPISKYIIRKFKLTNAVMLGNFKSLKRKKENEKA